MLALDRHHHRILIGRDLVAIPPAAGAPAAVASLVTVAANIAHYGYGLAADAYAALARLGQAELVAWWCQIEPVLAALTGADKKMASFVVYRNFPTEVLAMDRVEYWARQLLMYWGVPNELVTQPEQPRPPLADAPAFRMLQLADAVALPRAMQALFALPARWIEAQWDDVRFLVRTQDRQVELAALPFVENRIRLAAYLLECGATVTVASATDVLRLAAALSGGDVSLRAPCKLRRFTRRERRYLLAMLEGAEHLDEDLARRRETWKRLLHLLHPGDYRDHFPRVVAAYDKLYNGAALPTFNAELERRLAARDRGALALLQARPGEYMRRLHATLLAFGPDSVRAFAEVVGKLTTIQLLKLQRYLETVDERAWRRSQGRRFPHRHASRARSRKRGPGEALSWRLDGPERVPVAIERALRRCGLAGRCCHELPKRCRHDPALIRERLRELIEPHRQLLEQVSRRARGGRAADHRSRVLGRGPGAAHERPGTLQEGRSRTWRPTPARERPWVEQLVVPAALAG